MENRSKNAKATPGEHTQPASKIKRSGASSSIMLSGCDGWLCLLLALATFFIYWPSLSSDFVYDGREEILEEGFITSLSNLPAVLSLKVLGMQLMLGDRPGQLLFLMLNAAIWGREPFGYHLSCNLLHATNVALLYLFLRRLCAQEFADLARNEVFKVRIAIVVASLIFAFHPISVEPVSAINYSSDLLVTFFSLSALLAATYFRVDNLPAALRTGSVATFCAFAAVTCKESGAATAPLLLAYWFFFRRGEPKGPWFLLVGAAAATTAAFLTARFRFAAPNDYHLSYLGGSFSSVFLIQPKFWVFMMGHLLWPVHLSADYTLQNVSGITTAAAAAILVVVVLLQVWLAVRSPLGALGVAIYWLGLATVSNFFPLYRILADRFYYLPMVGVALQLVALLLMAQRSSRSGFWIATAPLLVALVPLTALTLARQTVFAGEMPLWTDTLRASPFSATAHNGLGLGLYRNGQLDDALAEFQMALKIDPNCFDARDNLASALGRKGQMDEAIPQLQLTLQASPNFAKAHSNLGIALFETGQTAQGIAEFQKALLINPDFPEAHFNLGIALVQQGQLDQGIAELRKAVRLDPTNHLAQKDLALAEATAGQNAAHP